MILGEGSICQGGGGEEQGPAGQKVDDTFVHPLTSTPMQQPKQDSEEVPQVIPDQGETRKNSQKFEEQHKCNCGHKGPIANHLRSSPQCVQSIRDDLSLGAEMSEEVLITQATLVLGGCPAVDCPGGDHAKMPNCCLSWWKKVGWDLMQWQGPASDLNSDLVRERAKTHVNGLIYGSEQQEPKTPNNAAEGGGFAGD